MIAIGAKESRKQDVTIKLMKDIIRFGYSGQRKEYIQEVGLGFFTGCKGGCRQPIVPSKTQGRAGLMLEPNTLSLLRSQS